MKTTVNKSHTVRHATILMRWIASNAVLEAAYAHLIKNIDWFIFTHTRWQLRQVIKNMHTVVRMSKARLTSACKRKKRLGVNGYWREFPLREFLLSAQGLPSSNNKTPSTTVRGNHSINRQLIHRRKKMHNKNYRPLKMLLSIALLAVMTGTGHAAKTDDGAVSAAEQASLNSLRSMLRCESRANKKLRNCANKNTIDNIKSCLKAVKQCATPDRETYRQRRPIRDSVTGRSARG